jgi:hypothetical protein
MLPHDAGVLCAPTAFGKTVMAAAIIARRGVNTLVLVHRTELLKQWQERLQAFFGAGKAVVGTIGGGKAKPTGKIDIAVMQSLSRQGEVNALVENYGQVIVDECHHVGAASFDAILKRTKAKFVLGLTATPIRRDGQQPIIFMQCGPIRHTAARPASAPHDLEVSPRSRFSRIDLPRQRAFRTCSGILPMTWPGPKPLPPRSAAAFEQGRKVLVLTERTEHLDAILLALQHRYHRCLYCTGGCQRSSGPPSLPNLMRCRLRRRASCWPPGNWSAKDSTTRRWTRWCWPCRFPGKAPCSSTRVACTENTPARPMCGSSTSSTPATRRCCGCGRSASAAIARWGIE